MGRPRALVALGRDDGPLHPPAFWAAARAFAALGVAYAVQVRFENALLLPFAWAVWRGPRRALILPILAFVFPASLAVRNAHFSLPGFNEGPASALASLRENLPFNLAALAAVPGAFLLAPGLTAAPFRKEGRACLALAAAYLLVYSAFFRGRFEWQERYMLGVLVPLLAAAGAGWDLLLPRTPSSTLALLAPFLAFNAAAPEVPQLPGPSASAQLLRSAAAEIPDGAYVLTFTPPAARVLTGRPAADIHYVLENRTDFERERAADGAAPQLACGRTGLGEASMRRPASSRRGCRSVTRPGRSPARATTKSFCCRRADPRLRRDRQWHTQVQVPPPPIPWAPWLAVVHGTVPLQPGPPQGPMTASRVSQRQPAGAAGAGGAAGGGGGAQAFSVA
ncbi:MAG: hypothetical protein HYX59_13035 [Elusimicrobia bacterium]|nr:hypothetical protein [Elusimicrobiota bacterium]